MIPEELDAALRVAVVARSERQRRYFAELLEPYGVQIIADDTLRECLPEQLNRSVADVLLVDLEEDESAGDLDVDVLIDQAQLPMLFNDGEASKRHAPTSIAGRAWGRRLADKLGALVQNEPTRLDAANEAPTLKLVPAQRQAVDLSAELGFELDSDLSVDMAGAAADQPEIETPAPTPSWGGPEELSLAELTAEDDAALVDGFALKDLPTITDDAGFAQPSGLEDIPTLSESLTLSDELALEDLSALSDAPELSTEWTLEQVPTLSDDWAATEGLVLADLPLPAGDGFMFEAVAAVSDGLDLVEEPPLAEADSADETAHGLGTADPASVDQMNELPVWVLGASIGGPQAVKEFIAELPAGIAATFIVAQHIGNGFVDLLASQLGRVTELDVRAAESGMALRAGQIVVAPVEQRITFSNGVMALQPNRRKSVYSPSIDDVMTEVAQAFGPKARAIVFSGMGSDGVEGARAIVAAGGTVWGQEASTCVISSMADAAREAGIVSETGAPAELARRLLNALHGESGE